MLYQFHSKEFSQTLPIQLWMFGANHLQEPVRRPQGVPYFQWFYCVKGQGELILDEQRSIITKGQGFLIYPDQEHIYQAVTNNWTLHIIAFNGPLCSTSNGRIRRLSFFGWLYFRTAYSKTPLAL